MLIEFRLSLQDVDSSTKNNYSIEKLIIPTEASPPPCEGDLGGGFFRISDLKFRAYLTLITIVVFEVTGIVPPIASVEPFERVLMVFSRTIPVALSIITVPE